MAKTVRMNLNVEDDIPNILAVLAGGQRKMGDYLGRLIRQVAASQESMGEPGEMDTLRSAVNHLAAKVKELDARLTQLDQQSAKEINR